MKIPKFESIYFHEEEQIHDKVNSLIAGYNGWCEVVDTFCSNPLLRKMYESKMFEMRKTGSYGMATCIVSVIKDLAAYAADN